MIQTLSEFDIIKTYFSPLTVSENGAFNLTDDAAIMEIPNGRGLVVTTDTLVE